jgi:alpha-beta hydrolase superfamily lysophospholipase
MLVNGMMIFTELYSVENPKGLIILTHGIALHSTYYKNLVKMISASGFDVLTYDVRGHGKSQGKRGDIDNFKTFTSDLHKIVETNREKYSKIILMGHSMGGIITNAYSVQYDDYDASIVLSAPTEPHNFGIFNLLPLWMVGQFKVKTNFKDSRLSHLTPSDNVDPYALKYFTFRLISQITRKAPQFITKNIIKIQKPILILHGTDDKLVPISQSDNFYHKLSVKDKTFIPIETGYHNLHDDTVTPIVGEVIVDWLNRHF